MKYLIIMILVTVFLFMACSAGQPKLSKINNSPDYSVGRLKI